MSGAHTEETRVAWRGYLRAGACAACAGAAIAIGQYGVERTEALDFSFWLFVFAAPLSLIGAAPVLRRTGRPTERAWWLALGHAGLSFVAVWALWSGVRLIGAALGSFLGRTETLVTVALAIVILGERFRRIEAVGAVLAVGGVAILRFPGAEELATAHTKGYWLVVGGTACFGAAEILTKWALRHADPRVFVSMRNTILLGAFAAAAAIAGDLTFPPMLVLASVFGVALLAPTLARMLFMTSLRDIDLAKAAVVNQAQPLFAALVAFALFGTLPTSFHWAGGALLLIGCGLVAAGSGVGPPKATTRD